MHGLSIALPLLASLLCEFAGLCTPALFKYFTYSVLGFIALPGRRTVQAIAQASGLDVHAHNFHRFFSEYDWAHRQVPGLLCRVVFRVLGIRPGSDGRYPLFGAVDDTVTEHRGAKKTYGVSSHRDPLARPKEKKYVRGHCVVLTGLLWRLPGGRWLFFALATAMYVTHKALRPDEVFPGQDRLHQAGFGAAGH